MAPFVRAALLAVVLTITSLCVAQDISTDDGNLDIHVPRDKDLTFSRDRRDTVSVWSVADRLTVLEKVSLGDMEERILSKMDDKLAAFETRMVALFSQQFELSTSSAVKTITATATSLQDSLEKRVNNVEGKLTDGIKAVPVLQEAVASLKAQEGRDNTAIQTLRAEIQAVADDVEDDLKVEVAALVKKIESNGAGEAAATPLPRKVCQWGPLNTGKRSGKLIACDFVKKEDDTVLELYLSMNARIIGNGQTASWFFTVDGSVCRSDSGSTKGEINTKFHASGNINLHRVMHLHGTCFRTASGKLNKGRHQIAVMITSNGDSYSGWSSNTRLSITEVVKPENQLL